MSTNSHNRNAFCPGGGNVQANTPRHGTADGLLEGQGNVGAPQQPTKPYAPAGYGKEHGRKGGLGLMGTFGEVVFLPKRAATIGQRRLRGLLNRSKENVTERREDHLGQGLHGNASRWLRRVKSTSLRQNRRLSSPVMPAVRGIPSHELPENHFPLEYAFDATCPPYSIPGGTAARAAAAAAHNEIHESAIALVPQDIAKLTEPAITADSESGIGIDVRENSDADFSLSVTCKDPSLIVPEELLAQIIAYLDATSMMNAELVSRRWYRTASSNHAWKYVFRREHYSAYSPFGNQSPISYMGGSGLGTSRPDQDWKRMWQVRKALQARWLSGKAAAIYLEGHQDSVYCVQFDEHKILTGSRDRTIRVWDAHTYECIKVLGVPKFSSHDSAHPPVNHISRGQKPMVSVIPHRRLGEPCPDTSQSLHHDGSILCLQFDRDIMVTGSSDTTCIMWDMKDDYKPIRRLRHHTAGVLDVCFDDKTIVSCSKDTTICLWDRDTGEFRRALTGHRGPVNAVQLRGHLIVSASGDGVAKLWNLTSGLCIKEFPSKDRGLACVEFSPDSRTILAGGNDQVIYQFDANSGELVRELKGHKGLVRSLHLDSANGRVISGSYDTSVKAYDVGSGGLICDFAGWTTSWMLSAKSDYRRIIATSQDSRAVIMDFGYRLPGIEFLEG